LGAPPQEPPLFFLGGPPFLDFGSIFRGFMNLGPFKGGEKRIGKIWGKKRFKKLIKRS